MKSSRRLERAALALSCRAGEAVPGTGCWLSCPARSLGLPWSGSLEQRLEVGWCLGIPKVCKKGLSDLFGARTSKSARLSPQRWIKTA